MAPSPPPPVSAADARRRARRTTQAMLWQSFCSGVVLFQPFHALLLASIVGSASGATFFISLTAVLTAVLEVPSGVLADLWGRRATLVVGSGCLLLAHLSLYAATAWMEPNLQAGAAAAAAGGGAAASLGGVGVGVVGAAAGHSHEAGSALLDGRVLSGRGAGASTGDEGAAAAVAWAPWLLLCLRALLVACAESLQSGTDDALLYDVVLEEAQTVAAARKRNAASEIRGGGGGGGGDDGDDGGLVDVDAEFKTAAASKSMMWPLGAAAASVLSGVLLGSSSSRAAVRVVVLASLLPAAASAVCAVAMHEAEPAGRRHSAAATTSTTSTTSTTADTESQGEQRSSAGAGAEAPPTPSAGVLLSSPRAWAAHARQALDVLTRTPELQVLAVSGVLTVAFADCVHLINPLFFAAKRVPVAWLGAISTGMYGCSYLGSRLSVRAAQAVGDRRALLLATAWMVGLNLCAAALPASAGPAAAAGCLVLSSLAWGLRFPLAAAMTNRATPSAERATVVSMMSLLTRAGLAVMVPVAGVVVDEWSADAAVVMSAVGMAAAGLLLLRLPREEGRRE